MNQINNDVNTKKNKNKFNKFNENKQENKINNDGDNEFITKKPAFFNKYNKNKKKQSRNNQENQENKRQQHRQPPVKFNPAAVPVIDKNEIIEKIKQNEAFEKKNQKNKFNNKFDKSNKTDKYNKKRDTRGNFNGSNFNAVRPAAEKSAEIEYNYEIENEIENENEDEYEVMPAMPVVPEAADTGPKIEIVGIRYKPVGKIYFYGPNGAQYSPNEKIIVESAKGLELGYIAIPNKLISENKVVQPLKPIIRKASEDDVNRSEKNKILAKETIKIANDRIKFHNLNTMKMKIIEAEYTFDNSKLTYFFTADGRVDFRELVKDLAAIFKTRIEMRQIGIRDQTKILGGLSICGRPFCCNSFLQDFAQVTIKMAKEQNLSINSSKISGACGRLMCCLKYEHEAYEYLSKDMPKVSSIVEASSGETGMVIDSNIMTGICKVKLNQKTSGESGDAIKQFPKKSLKVIGFMKNEHEHIYDGDNSDTGDNN